ncbi:MAG: DUF6463 family protein [Prevotella sp.]|jgi:hypothetical protein|nr:DUF6463 family protein [Prevotella sp.]
MKIFNIITNGILLIIIAVLHTSLAIEPNGGGKQFSKMAETNFYKVSSGAELLPIDETKSSFADVEILAIFWFFYFGLLLIPLGLLVHSIERKGGILPLSFTVPYFLFVLVGSYMMPNSGMTFIMLPHAAYMLVINIIRNKKKQPTTS